MKVLEQLKPLSLKMQEATSKNVAFTEKKGKQYVRQIMYTNQGHLSIKVTSVIDYIDEPQSWPKYMTQTLVLV